MISWSSMIWSYGQPRRIDKPQEIHQRWMCPPRLHACRMSSSVNKNHHQPDPTLILVRSARWCLASRGIADVEKPQLTSSCPKRGHGEIPTPPTCFFRWEIRDEDRSGWSQQPNMDFSRHAACLLATSWFSLFHEQFCGFVSHSGTPSHHPFQIGIFPWKYRATIWGYPHDYGNPHITISIIFPLCQC